MNNMYEMVLTYRTRKNDSGWTNSESILEEWGSVYPIAITEEQLSDEITGYADEYGLRNMFDRLESEGIDERYIMYQYSPTGQLISRVEMWESDAISSRLSRLYAGTAKVNR